MNFFPAELKRGEDGRYTAEAYGLRLELPEERQALLKDAGRASGQCVMGVRPEHIQIVSGDAPGAFRAKVDVAEMMGSEFYLHMNLEGQDMVARAQTDGDMGHEAFENGRDVYFTFPMTQAHLFDVESGVSLFAR
jgi:ABC-type sugar transport system ATPase subunit